MSNKSRNILLIIIIGILCGLTVILTGYYINYKNKQIHELKETDNSNIEQDNNTDVYEDNNDNSDIYEEDNIINNIEYNISLDDSWNVKIATKEYPFIAIKENDFYEYYNEEKLGLKDGKPYISKNDELIESNIDDVKIIYLMFSGTYGSYFSFLKTDGSVYIGKNMIMIDDDGNYTLADAENFNNVQKLESNNTYTELRKVSIGWKTDDTEETHFIGITESGNKDLIKLN